LRFYFWLNALPGQKAQVVCYPVGCAETESTTRMTPAGRRWIGLDPASVPQRLYDGTAAAARTLGELTSSRAIFGCIDWGYGYAAGSRQEPGWNAVEGNFCGPRVLGPREYSQIGPILHEHHVDFIARAAGSN
jgi:hypothetical protein